MDDYTKELRRLRKNLKQKIRYYNAKGYELDPSFVNDLTLEELKSVTNQQLIEDIYFEQQEKQQEYEEYQIFPDEVEMIISNFRDSYSNFNETATAKIDTWLERLIQNRGAWAVAVMLDEASNNGHTITNKEIYGDLNGFLTEFFDYLPSGYEFNNWEIGEIMNSLEEQWDDNSYWGY